MLTRRTVVTAIAEAVYGTDPVMTGSNAILAWDVNLDIKGEVLERIFLRDSLSPMPHVIGMKEVELSFKTEIVGSNSAPMIAPLLSACGFGTGVTSGTALNYALVSTEINMPSASLYVFKDGNRHKVTGSRGNLKITAEAGKYGIAEFTMRGLYNAVDAAAIPDIAGLSANKPPICYSSAFQIGGFSPVSSKLEIDLGNEIARSDSLNATTGVGFFRIASRKPTMSFDADAVVEASNPFWGDWSGAVVDTFAINIGTVAGNRLLCEGIFELSQNKYGDKDGISKYDCQAALVSSDANSQNDEFKLKYVLA